MAWHAKSRRRYRKPIRRSPAPSQKLRCNVDIDNSIFNYLERMSSMEARLLNDKRIREALSNITSHLERTASMEASMEASMGMAINMEKMINDLNNIPPEAYSRIRMVQRMLVDPKHIR